MRAFRLTDRFGEFRTSSEENILCRLGTATAPAFGPTLKLVCWNMFKARKRGVLQDLATVSSAADLVLLQEAVLHGGTAQPFHTASGMEWLMVENLRHAYEHLTTGPKTGSRVAASSSAFVRSHAREPLINTPKTFLYSVYPLTDSAPLLVVNVHAINLVSKTKFATQVEQIVAPVAAHKGPCIVAGDFNTWNEARMHVLDRAMNHAGLARVPVSAPQWRHFGQVLDHVFFRDIRLIHAHALTHVKTSDHVPLAAEFDLRPA